MSAVHLVVLTQPTCEFSPHLHFVHCLRVFQRLGIGVDSPKLHTLHPGVEVWWFT